MTITFLHKDKKIKQDEDEDEEESGTVYDVLTKNVYWIQCTIPRALVTSDTFLYSLSSRF